MELSLITSGLVAVSSFAGYRIWKHKQQQKALIDLSNFNLLRLHPKISWCHYLENVGDAGNKLYEQYQTICKLYRSSLEVLGQKFNVTEMTFMRYQQIINSTHTIFMDNLVKLTPLLETLDTVGANEGNQKSLMTTINGLFSMNEQLIEKLNELIVNLSAIKSLTGPDEKTTQFLLDNLKNLIERAKSY